MGKYLCDMLVSSGTVGLYDRLAIFLGFEETSSCLICSQCGNKCRSFIPASIMAGQIHILTLQQICFSISFPLKQDNFPESHFQRKDLAITLYSETLCVTSYHKLYVSPLSCCKLTDKYSLNVSFSPCVLPVSPLQYHKGFPGQLIIPSSASIMTYIPVVRSIIYFLPSSFSPSQFPEKTSLMTEFKLNYSSV